MARNQTFSVSLNLLTKNFNKGIKAVQNSLRSLRAQFQTFVGGIGVGLGFQELIDNAKSLDKVQTTLRNVSGSFDQYGENMKFIQGLSKKYNQDLITLTGNYAKFYSAASYAGFALEEQQHIYESLTRASAYFNLTADETNGVMLAVQQMISKGRVSSEELRRQLGERLPGAMNLAAIAAGKAGITVNGTTAELEEMIRQGKVLAKDLLPALANELNSLTVNLNVDTIQGATAKLRNSFTELVKKLKVGDIYKGFLNGVSSGLEYVSNNLRKVAESIAIVFGTLFLKGGFTNMSSNWNKFFSNLKDKLSKTRAEAKILKADLKEIINNPDNNIEWDKKYNAPKVTGKENPEALDKALKLKRKIAALDHNANNQQERLNHKLKTYVKHLGGVAKGLLKTVGIQAAYYAISAAISTIITKIASWAQEQKRVKNIVKDTAKEFDKLSNTLGAQDVELETMKSTLNDDSKQDSREDTIKRINQLLGLQGKTAFTVESTNKEINAAIDKRLKLLKEERQYQAANNLIAEKRSRIEELRLEKQAAYKNIEEYKKQKETITGTDAGSNTSRDTLIKLINKEEKAIEKWDEEIDNLNKAIGKIMVDSNYSILSYKQQERQRVLENTNPEPITDPDELKKLQEDYDKIQKEHDNKLRALNEQLADEIITKEDYDKALKDLYTSTLESIYSLEHVNENTDSFAKSILDRVKAFKANEKKESEVEKALNEYSKERIKLANQLHNGVISQQEYDDALLDLRDEVAKQLAAMGNLTGAAQALADTYKKQKSKAAVEKMGEIESPQVGEYDSLLNYKKSNSEIYQDKTAFLEDYADQLDEYIKKLKEYQDELTGSDLQQFNIYITELETSLETLTGKVDSFAQAAKFAEVQEDVKNLKQELNEGIWDNISGIASAAERLTNSFKSLQETWDDPDASGWEKFITTFTTIISVIETIVSVVKTFNAAMKVAEGLALATAAAEGAQIPVKVQDAIATKAQAVAAKELAVARHLASSASVPYPANIAAIASTSAALAAAFAAIPKFAKGGIVAGSSTQGDRNLVRANAGEMILTKGQQGTLWNMLNGKASTGSGNVEFKIKGSELVGVLNNYSKKISK